MSDHVPSRAAKRALVVALLAGGVLVAVYRLSDSPADASLTAVVRRSTLAAQLTATGTLRAAESLTYRSPVPGRDVEIVELVPEGTRVKEGDLLIRLDTTELTRDIDRARQELRQMQMDLQVAHIERQEAEATVKAVNEGEGALTVAEAEAALDLAVKKVARLRTEHEQLQPLLARGFITREEFAGTVSELEEAERTLALVRKRTEVTIQLAHPRERQRAVLQLAQKNSQVENLVGRVQEADVRLQQLQALVEDCTIYARRAGLVVYEQYFIASPRRKIRVGDRVTASQGLVTIPEVSRMLVEASLTEADVHRVKAGQPAFVRLEAFPDLRLTGRVARVGTLASSSIERPFEDKRFDLIVDVDGSNPDLRPEMTARVDVNLGVRDRVLLIPVTAVFEEAGSFLARVAGPAGAETRRVQLGESDGQSVEVLDGLRENEVVVLGGGTGAPVPPASAPAAPGAGSLFDAAQAR